MKTNLPYWNHNLGNGKLLDMPLKTCIYKQEAIQFNKGSSYLEKIVQGYCGLHGWLLNLL
jgi:hypothetical protein